MIVTVADKGQLQSFGAYMACQMAACHPELAQETLILLSPDTGSSVPAKRCIVVESSARMRTVPFVLTTIWSLLAGAEVHPDRQLLQRIQRVW